MDSGFNQTELLMLILGLAGLLLLGVSWRRLSHVPHRGLVGAAMAALVAAWVATNLEELFWGDLFELIDHAGYFLFGLLICIWCTCIAPPGERRHR